MTVARNTILIFMEAEPFARSIKKAFDASGYQSTIVTTESAAYAAARTSLPSLIIIDRLQRTLTNLRQLQTLVAVPIVAVQEGTAPCTDDDCIQDYDHGIDLVICSQSPRELVARVRAILRRREPRHESNSYYSAGAVRMDLDRHEVTVTGRLVELTPKEFQILHQFLESPSRAFSRQEMLNRVWGDGFALEEHALDVHIHSLRQKIEVDPACPKIIVTVRGIGYKLRA
ncbi:MAG: response regulator transcription factor [Nitrospirota bacterium]|nr:response regulator transcription factor [Nitrospirota bacterium]MDP3596931.1 response regulator transcription factor [Nitrospirota bacterium]